jgi:hypothetical protein
VKFSHFSLASSPKGSWLVFAGNSPQECDEAGAQGKVYMRVDGSLTAGEVCHYIDLANALDDEN